MIILFIIFGICSSFVDVSRAQNLVECQTPNKTSGFCVPLKKCDSLFSILSFSPTDEQKDFIDRSQCENSKRTDPIVCCPSEMNSTSKHEGKFTASDLPRPGRCGTIIADKIFGGTKAGIQDYPWMGIIHYRKRGKMDRFLCGGTLINENYVVTAAHCILGPNIVKAGYSPDYVRLGENDFRTSTDCEDDDCADPVANVEIAKTIVHENYNPRSRDQSNDIALIRLAKSPPQSDFIRPICLPIAEHLKNKDYDNTTLTVVGFGKTKNASQSEVKLELKVKGFNFKECEKIMQKLTINLSAKQMCAGGVKDEDSCTGDSGGPLSSEDDTDVIPYSYLAGIVSFGLAACGTSGVPGVYTRVDQYIDWILNNMEK